MLGAIVGDIVGSRFELTNNKTKDFNFFTKECHITDDSVMTLSLGMAFLIGNKSHKNLKDNAIKCMQEIGRKYPNCGYGRSFYRWIFSENPRPYNSYGNGAAMRISPVAFVAKNLEEVVDLSKKLTEISHNHPEAIKGAQATAISIYLAKRGHEKEEIEKYIDKNYYSMNFSLDEIRKDYSFDVSCQGSVPQALKAFFESDGFEDAIRNAISIGGDSDTIGAICGSISQAYYGIEDPIRQEALGFLDDRLLKILVDFEEKYM